MEWSSGWDHEAKKVRWLQAREGCGGDDAVIWFNLFGCIQTCLCVANLPFIWQPVQIWTHMTRSRCMPPDHIHPPCKYSQCMPHSWDPITISASWNHIQIHIGSNQSKKYCRDSNSLQMRTCAYSLENSTWWWLCQSLQKWHSCQMLWWYLEACLSSNIHVLCWLPWEVSHIIFELYRLMDIPGSYLLQFKTRGFAHAHDAWFPSQTSIRSDSWVTYWQDYCAFILIFSRRSSMLSRPSMSLGKPLKGVAVEHILKAYLLVPTVVSAWSFIFHKGIHEWSEHL